MEEQAHKSQMKKVMIVMLIGVSIIFGAVFISKAIGSYLFKRFMASQPKAVSVSTMKVEYSLWQPELRASGSLRAINGVNVTTELAGMVQTIYFQPGSIVNQGNILVQLNANAEIGSLHSLQAQLELAKITLARDTKQYAIRAISKQTLDSDVQNVKNLDGQVTQQAATVAKKSIRAPFAGRLGVNNINLGQYLNAGDKVATLQQLDPIYADFYVPQQQVVNVKVGQTVNIKLDVYPNKNFAGQLTTVEPVADVNTRNVLIEATLPNPDHELIPGMFATVVVNIGSPTPYLTLPLTAVSFNPYGEIVYVVRESDKKDKKGSPILITKQAFVVTGDTRGDQVQILEGLKEGETVVTSGQLKLKNGSEVVINNSVVPENNPHPMPPNER